MQSAIKLKVSLLAFIAAYGLVPLGFIYCYHTIILSEYWRFSLSLVWLAAIVSIIMTALITLIVFLEAKINRTSILEEWNNFTKGSINNV